MTTKFINVASLRKPPVVVITTEDGNNHPMRPATVAVFLENLKDIEDLGINASPKKEAETTIRAILRAFPTLTEADVHAWDVTLVQQLYEVILKANGEVASQDAAVIEEAKKTGKSVAAV